MLVSRSKIIDARAKEIWPYLTNLDKEIKWRKPQVVKLKYSKGNKCEPGARVTGTTNIMGNKDTYENEITKIKKNKLVAWEAVPNSSDIGSTGKYLLEDYGGKAKMTIAIDYIPQNIKGWFLLPMVKIMAPRMLDNFLRQLADLVE